MDIWIYYLVLLECKNSIGTSHGSYSEYFAPRARQLNELEEWGRASK